MSGSLSAFLTKFIIRTVEGGEAAEAAQPGVMLFVEKLVRKAAHVTECALLGFLLRLQAGAYALRRPTRWCFLAGMIRAALDEVHQLFVPGRGGMWQDVLLDGCGVLAGIVVAYTCTVLAQRWQDWKKRLSAPCRAVCGRRSISLWCWRRIRLRCCWMNPPHFWMWDISCR